jgi:RAT1-interacting protein
MPPEIQSIPMSASDLIDFSSAAYWEQYYRSHPELFDWYEPWANLRTRILPFLGARRHILNLGCGSSPMSCDMLEEGIGFISNIDISETVIKQMQDRYRSEYRLGWYTMDCRNLSAFPGNHFDAVIEKGTLDALSCSDEGQASIHEMLTEIFRVLRPKSWFISISYGAPQLRKVHFQKPELPWIVNDPIAIPKTMVPGAFYHVYVAQKM